MDKKIKNRLKTMSEKRKKHIKYMIFIMKGKTKWSLVFIASQNWLRETNIIGQRPKKDFLPSCTHTL